MPNIVGNFCSNLTIIYTFACHNKSNPTDDKQRLLMVQTTTHKHHNYINHAKKY